MVQQRYQGYGYHELSRFIWKRPKDGFVWVDNFDWADNFQWGDWSTSILSPDFLTMFEPSERPITTVVGFKKQDSFFSISFEGEFKDAVRRAGPFLVPKEFVNNGGKGYYAESYSPLEEKRLFTQFADLNPGNREDILKFANQWGNLFSLKDEGFLFLTGLKVQRMADGEISCTPGNGVLHLDSFKEWHREIWHMKRLRFIWDLIQDAENKGLDSHIRPFVRWDEKNKRVWFNNGVIIHENEYEAVEKGDCVAALQFFLMKSINEKLRKNPVHLRLLWDKKEQRIKPHAVPTNLLGAMYYQFYQAVTGEEKFKRCVVCGQWEHVERSNWLYHKHCGGTWRSRKKRGLDAIRRGKKTPAQVALELGVSEEEVLGWLQSL